MNEVQKQDLVMNFMIWFMPSAIKHSQKFPDTKEVKLKEN
jgi:hypothetical protein